MQKGNTLVIAIVIIALLLVGGGVAYVMTQSQNTAAPEDAMEATTDESSNVAPTDTEAMMEEDGGETDSSEAVSEDEITINLSAENYSYSQEEIRVQQGDTVTIVLDITAGTHDWNLDEFDASTDVISTGETTEVTFVASEAGEYEYYCSVGNHRQLGMVGTLIVE